MAGDDSTAGSVGRAHTKRIDKLAFSAFLLGLTTLSCIFGAGLVEFGTPVHRGILSPGFDGIRDVVTDITGDPANRPLWGIPWSGDQGVLVSDRSRMQPGMTLYTSGHRQAAYLIEADGTVVHEWAATFREVWPDAAHVASPVDPEYIHWRDVALDAHGNVFVVFEAAEDAPYGYGLAKIDRDSEVVWTFDEAAHHVVRLADDGTVLVLTHAYVDAPPALEGVDQLLVDYVVRISPDGKVLSRVSVLDAYLDSPYAYVPESVDRYFDLLHSNDIEPVSASLLAAHPYLGSADYVVLSRHSGFMGAIDEAQGRVTWASRAMLFAPHDVDLLENGNVLVFDNQGRAGPWGLSRVVEFDPRSNALSWQFAGDANAKFESGIRSSQQRLANGNTLITESEPGRMLEVTADGSVVWDYRNPIRSEDGKQVPVVCGGYRFGIAELDFLR